LSGVTAEERKSASLCLISPMERLCGRPRKRRNGGRKTKGRRIERAGRQEKMYLEKNVEGKFFGSEMNSIKKY
jgi:hypothetical protein